MFAISSTPLEVELLTKALAAPEAGACTTFVGWVRNHNDGRAVTGLTYEVYRTLAQKEGERICGEAQRRFAIEKVAAVHREGELHVGEAAVWVGATAVHRDAAFSACRYVIDAIKHRLPVWKKEHYVDGPAHWVICSHREGPHPTVGTAGDDEQQHGAGVHTKTTPSDFYARQQSVIGTGGQSTLQRTRILVVGAGGLGCPALTYLAGAGVGTITVCDSDRLETSNLHRQTLYAFADIGKFKAERAAERLRALNPYIDVFSVPERLTPDNAHSLVQTCDIVLDCTDNFATKFILHDTCLETGRALVQASVHGFSGQVLSVIPTHPESGCLRCLWPETPTEDCVSNCADAGILGAVPGVLGAAQALAALRIALGHEEPSARNLVLYDLTSGATRTVGRQRNPACPTCQHLPVEARHRQHDQNTLAPWEISAANLTPKHTLIDIRERSEQVRNPCSPFCHDHWPLSEQERFMDLPTQQTYVFACARGQRSKRLVAQLREQGYRNVFSLREGLLVYSS